MVREFGGRRFAYLLAATVVFFCPIYLTMDGFLSMNSFESLFWMGCVAVAMRIVRGRFAPAVAALWSSSPAWEF